MKKTLLLLITLFFMAGITTAQDSTQTQKKLSPEQLKFEIAKNYSTGWEYYKNKMYKEAIPPLKKVLELNPKKMSAWRYLAFSYQHLSSKYQQEGKTDLASAYLDSTKMVYYNGIKVDSTYSYFYEMLGYIYLTTGKLDSAEYCYEKVVELDKMGKVKYKVSKFKARKVLGDIAYKEEDFETALDWYNEASSIDPSNTEVLKKIEEIAKFMGDVDVVVEKLEQQIKNNPNDTLSYVKLAKTLLKNQEYEKAITTLESLLKLTPNNIQNLILYGKALESIENYKKAINIFKKVLKSDPKNKEALAEIALCYASINSIDAAKRYICKALRYYPKYNRAIWNKGQIIEKIAASMVDKDGQISYKGKFVYEKAIETYKKLLKDPELGKNANVRIRFLKQFKRTKEDLFMHQNEPEPQFDFGC